MGARRNTENLKVTKLIKAVLDELKDRLSLLGDVLNSMAIGILFFAAAILIGLVISGMLGFLGNVPCGLWAQSGASAMVRGVDVLVARSMRVVWL